MNSARSLTGNLNSPIWTPQPQPKDPRVTRKTRDGFHPEGTHGGFQEVWYLKLNHPATQSALWLRFTLLISENGFRRVAETWAIFFERAANREVSKTAIKQTHELSVFSHEGANDGAPVIRMADCSVGAGATRGKVDSKTHSIAWNLTYRAAIPDAFDLVPDALKRAKIVKNTVVTPGESLLFSGTITVDGKTLSWADAPGMQGHIAGPRNGHSWVWGHCNAFVDEDGKPSDLVFEGLTARALLLGRFPSPRLSAFFFHYDGVSYPFNTLGAALQLRSESDLTHWRFEAQRGAVSFRGEATSEHKDFAGLTYEDTDGSLLYCSNSKLSDMKVLVYRAGKLEASLHAPGTAAFEVVSREKNPYVPLLV